MKIIKMFLFAVVFVVMFTHVSSATVNYTGTHWDTAGSGNSYAYDITMNTTYFWIIDGLDAEVYQYYNNGTYTGTHWDTAGSGNANPLGITMDVNYFWVTDLTDTEVYQYYNNGTYTGTHWDTAGSGNAEPICIVMDVNYFWIVDEGDDEVYQYYNNGTYTGMHWDTAGSGNTNPRGITMDVNYFWVTDLTDTEVYQYYNNGTYTGTYWDWDTAGSGNTDPHGITRDADYFWIVDLTGAEVYQYQPLPLPSVPLNQTNLGNSLIDHTPTITWTNGTVAAGNTLTTYIYVGTTSTPTAIEGFTTEETYNLGTNIILTDGNIYYYRLRSYDGTSYSNYTTADEFRMNTPPSTPTIINPIDMSYTDSNETALNVSSTDAEGDSLFYYFYGDAVDGTTLINISTTGNYTWTTGFDYDIYHWKVRAYDSYEYSANTSLQQFTLLAPPDLQTPTNASTHTYPFPPLLHDLTFAWQNTGAPAYKFQVARDEDFHIIAESITTTGNITIKSLTADDYYWRVYAYETSTGTHSNASDVWEFTINETNGNGAVTAIDGVVYEITTGGSVEVDGALVNIWNSTWSDSMLVGQSGYYYFDGAQSGTYSVRATKTGYTDSSIELVTVQALNTTTRNILLQSSSGAGQQYVDHYVQFIVKSLLGTRYPGVVVNVYLDDAVIPTYTGTTGSDGSVAFELNENQQYRITFIDVSQGIDIEKIIYPILDSYNVYVIANIFATGGNIISDDISVSIETATAGANAYINVTYTDNKTETTALYFYLNQSNINDPQNQTLIASSGEIHATGFYSFTVTDYTGEAYLIHVHATHDTYGDIKESYSVRFEGLLDSFGWDGIWVLIALGCITFTAFMFGAKNATQGSFVICVEAWFFIAMGMFGDYNTIWFRAGVVMATVVSFLANMEKHDSERS